MKKLKIKKDNGQMIALMGVILSIAVLSIASLSAEISNINYFVETKQISTLSYEFNSIKETFGRSLNYNLIDVQENWDHYPGTILEGDINDIFEAFEQTKNEYFNIEFQHGRFFDAILNKYWYSYAQQDVYNVEIIFYLDDGYSSVNEKITYSIVCSPKIL